MSDPAAQVTSAVLILGIAAFVLLWQIQRAWRRSVAPDPLATRLFWLGAFAWVLLGLLLRRGGEWPALASVWRWLIPAAGLLAAAIARWAQVGVPRLLAEDAAAGGEGDGDATAEESELEPDDLDADDARLLHRLTALLERRAAGLMVPAADLRCVRADANLTEILELLAGGPETRIPVLDLSGTRALGIIDGGDLLPRLYTADHSAGSAATARDLCKVLPSVSAREPARRALETLRTGGAGAAAVSDPRGRVLGFLAWQPIFRGLLGRLVKGGAL